MTDNSRATICTIIGIYLVIAAFLGICGAAALLGLGAIAGVASIAGFSAAAGTGAPDAAAVGALTGLLGGLSGLIGILMLINAVLMLGAAWGLFTRKAWSRNLVIIVAGIGAVLSLLSVLGGQSLAGNIIPLVIDLAVIYFFVTDIPLRQYLSQ